METGEVWTEEEAIKRVGKAMAALDRGLSEVGLASEFLMHVSGFESEDEKLAELFGALCEVSEALKAREVTS